MEPITTNEFLNSVFETEVWKKVSEEETLSMEMLEQYEDKLDWTAISGNNNILWTIDGVAKFAYKIDWDVFSERCPDAFICETTLRKFDNRWNWKQLSNRDALFNSNRDLLEKFADKIDWAELITNWRIENAIDLFIRFQQYIPMAKLQESRLWEEMASERAKAIFKEMTGLK